MGIESWHSRKHTLSTNKKVIKYLYFFAFFVSDQTFSVNDVQGVRLHKPNKIKPLRGTKL